MMYYMETKHDKMVTTRLSTKLVKRVDRASKRAKQSRSETIRAAVELYLSETERTGAKR